MSEQAETEYRLFEEYQPEVMRKMEADLVISEGRKGVLEREYSELKDCIAREELIAAMQAELEEALVKLDEFEKAKPAVERRKEKISRAETAAKIIEAENAVSSFREELNSVESELKKEVIY